MHVCTRSIDFHSSKWLSHVCMPKTYSFATSGKTAVRGGRTVVAVVVIETRSHAASSTVGWGGGEGTFPVATANERRPMSGRDGIPVQSLVSCDVVKLVTS